MIATASATQVKRSEIRTYTYVKCSTTQGNMATRKGHYASGFKAKARVQCVQRNRDKHRHAHCNNMVIHSTYIQRNLHAQQSATLKTIVANSPAATTAAIAQDCNEQGNKAQALTSLATRTTWVFRNTQCVQCHQTTKLSPMQLVCKSVHRRQISSACSIQRSQAATTAYCAKCSTQAKTTIG